MTSSKFTKLDAGERGTYRARGYYCPLRAFSYEHASSLSGSFLAYWEANRDQLAALLPRQRASFCVETHLFLRWVYDIVAHPRILDAVESVLGPNVLAWSSQWFPKFPRDMTYVSWHQDATYWGLSPPHVTTAWVALSNSSPANGCLRVIPGSHQELLPQRETYAEHNMLSRGQEIAVEVDEAAAVDLILQPGEFSLHDIGIVHGSGPNESDELRLGLAIRYIAPEVVQRGRERDMVQLVRGRDDYGHFDMVAPPERDLAYGASRLHAESLARKIRNLMPGSESGQQQ